MKRLYTSSLTASVARGAVAILLMSSATQLLAQNTEASDDTKVEQDEPTNDIVVTGTLIRGIAPVGAPVLTIGREEIAKTGVGSTTELLRKIPQVSNIGADEAKTQTTANLANANNTFGNGINIRGLGTQATLTLVNGQRAAPAGIFGLYFDSSNIPTIALSGVDVVADGASALYGSDAIAGVVNLKLRSDLDGLDVSGRYGLADNYHSWQGSLAAGKKWDTGNVMLVLERSFHTALFALDRPNQYQADQRNAGGTDLRTTFANTPNIVVGTTIYGVPANPTGGALTFANLSTTPNLMSGWTGATAIPEQDRISVVFAGQQELSDSVKVYGQAFYTRRDFEKSFGRIGLAAQQSTIALRNTNPNFITGVPGVTTTQTVRLSWLDILGPEDASGYQSTYQFVAGTKIDLNGNLRIDVNYNRSRSKDVRDRLNQINLCGLQGLTTPLTPVCTIPADQVAGGVIAQPTPANAFNPFGPNSQSVIDRIRAQIRAENYYQQDSFAAKLDGGLFDIGGGSVRFALGAASMREEAYYQTFQNNDTADSATFRLATEGTNTRRVNSVFGEVVFPLVGADNAMPIMESLSVSVAGRYDHYSDQGTTTNPKVGMTWGVGSGLKLRGSYGKSFRASLIQTDPAANGGVTTRPLADYKLGAGATTPYIVLVGGNRSLKPEKARTINLGFDYNPDWAKSLSLSATYFDVNYTDIIDNPGNTIGTTGLTSAAREATFAAFIQRRPTDPAGSAAFTAQAQALIGSPLLLVSGGVPAASTINVIVDGRTFNSGRLKARGVDFSAFYNVETSVGEIEAGVVGTYFTKFDRSFSPLEALTDRRSLIEFPTKYNLRGSLSWQNGGVRMATFINHLPSYTNTFTAIPSKVSSYTTVDLTLGYTLGEDAGALRGLGFAIEAFNLLDKEPPLAFVANQLFDSNNASAMGRMVSFRVKKSF